MDTEKKGTECKHSHDGYHHYSAFGQMREECMACSIPHPEVKAWKSRGVAALEAGIHFDEPHPFILSGAWTRVDYRRYMASPRTKRYITK